MAQQPAQSAHGEMRCPHMPSEMGPNGPAVWAGFVADGPKSAQEPAHKERLKTRATSAKTNPVGRLGRF